MKKRSKIVLLLLIWIVLAAGAQQSRSPVDLVLLLDTSASMSSSYYDVGDYLTGPFLREFLQIGDTFHLISFSGTPKTELARRIEGQGDVQTIIGRMMLMYPFQPSSDIAAALGYMERYISALPAERRKQVVLITDGVHSETPDTVDLEKLITETSGRLKNSGTDFRFIRVPGQIPKSAGAVQAPKPPETAVPQASLPPVQSPAQTAVQPPARLTQTPAAAPPPAQAPVQTTQPPTARPSQVPAQTAVQPPARLTQTPAAAPPPAQAPVQTTQPPTARPVQTDAVQPPSTPPAAKNIIAPEPQRQTGEGFALPANILFIGLGILGAVILVLLVFLMLRRLHSSPGHAIAIASGIGPSPYAVETAAQDTAQTKQNADMLSGYATDQRRNGVPPPSIAYTGNDPAPGGSPLMLRLFVADQNIAIGRRNIHFVKPGFTFTIGGGNSDFLIFLVPLPPHIAEIRHDGRNCTFYPRRPEFFPDIGSQPVPDCVGKIIRVISEKGYELYIRVEKYEDPLVILNRLLTSIMVPSMPGADSKGS
jgi:hypothetical protein